jgi:hypothetical protein
MYLSPAVTIICSLRYVQSIAFVILLSTSWIMFPFVRNLIFVNYLNQFLSMVFFQVIVDPMILLLTTKANN